MKAPASAPVLGRFAPTPSGRLHLGNLLCAMLAYLSVKSQGGQFLLRIEDVDVPRCPQSMAQQIIDDLTWLGFTWDAPPLYQSARTEIYQHYLDKLDQRGLIYPCFCTRAQLQTLAAPNLGDTQRVYPGTCRHLAPDTQARLRALRTPSLRLRVPDSEICFIDGLYGTQRENLARDCGDFVLRRSDGLFSYQLAAVVDDALSGVNEIVRGRDILSATPRQIYLMDQLGFPVPHYIHIPLLTDASGRRLAKRDHDLDLSTLRKQYSPGEILGILAVSAGLTNRFRSVTLDELTDIFTWQKIPKADLRLRLPSLSVPQPTAHRKGYP